MIISSSLKSGAGYDRVQTSVSCVLTRFRTRSLWSTLHLYRLFRHVRRHTSEARGLMTALFLIEDLRTCYTLSLWRDEMAILEFNTKVRAHVDAANDSFAHITFAEGGPQLWSAQFHLTGISPCNLRWEGVDVAAACEARNTRAGRVQPAA